MNYFRITIYHPEHNVTAILDSYGYFEKLWMLSAFFVKKGWKVLNVVSGEHLDDGNIPRIQPDKKHLVLRACKLGSAEIKGNRIDVLGRHYKDLR